MGNGRKWSENNGQSVNSVYQSSFYAPSKDIVRFYLIAWFINVVAERVRSDFALTFGRTVVKMDLWKCGK